MRAGLIGIIIFISTLAYVPHLTLLLTVPTLALSKSWAFTKRISGSLLLILIFVFLTSVNRAVHIAKIENPQDLIPYTILVPVAYYIALNLRKNDLVIFIYLVGLEVLIGLVQFHLGIKTFFLGLSNYAEVVDSNFLYYRSVFGLSHNSSLFSQKVFLCFLLIDFLGIKGRKKYVLLSVFIVGLIISFNRSAILSVLLFYFLELLSIYRNALLSLLKAKINIKLALLILTTFILILIILTSVVYYHEFIIEQFTRNRGKVDLSNRDVIWNKFLEFILQNPLLGNGSYKYHVYFLKKFNHAHNSYLQIFATHGILISLLYLAIYIKSIHLKNFIFTIPILFYSLGQYGIFWGISVIDVIIFVFLFNSKLLKQNDE